MIFKQDDIAIFSHVDGGDLNKIKVTRFHKPTGVYFSVISRTQGFEYFEVAQLNSKGEKIDKKTFDGKNQKSFFETVDYFEELVAKREPQPEQEDPSVGVFIYIKGQNCFAEVFGNKVTIAYEDVEKVFTPPVKKKFGRLNMYEVDKPEYEIIKGKFALKFDEALTEKIRKELSIGTDNVFFAYKMTPYDTSQDGQSDDTPQDVNDDQLDINDIEGEDPQNMTGDNSEPTDGQGQGGEPTDGQGQGGEPTDGQGQGGEPTDGQGQGGEPTDGQGGENTREIIARQPQNAVEAIENALNVDLKSTYRKKGRIGRVLGAFSKDELLPMYQQLNINPNTSKEEFIRTISEITDNYLGNE